MTSKSAMTTNSATTGNAIDSTIETHSNNTTNESDKTKTHLHTRSIGSVVRMTQNNKLVSLNPATRQSSPPLPVTLLLLQTKSMMMHQQQVTITTSRLRLVTLN